MRSDCETVYAVQNQRVAVRRHVRHLLQGGRPAFSSPNLHGDRLSHRLGKQWRDLAAFHMHHMARRKRSNEHDRAVGIFRSACIVSGYGK
jgi:hypothetical protein